MLVGTTAPGASAAHAVARERSGHDGRDWLRSEPLRGAQKKDEKQAAGAETGKAGRCRCLPVLRRCCPPPSSHSPIRLSTGASTYPPIKLQLHLTVSPCTWHPAPGTLHLEEATISPYIHKPLLRARSVTTVPVSAKDTVRLC